MCIRDRLLPVCVLRSSLLAFFHGKFSCSMCILSSLISLVGKIWFTQQHSRWIKSDTSPEWILTFKYNQQFYVNRLLHLIFLFFLFYFFFTWTGYHFVKRLLFYFVTNQVNNNIKWKQKQTTYKQTYKIEEKQTVSKANLAIKANSIQSSGNFQW